MNRSRACLASFLSLVAVTPLPAEQKLSAPLTTLQAASIEGEGNVAASAAWREIVAQAKADDLVTLLGLVDSEAPIASNWIRSAIETVASRSQTLPAPALAGFVADHNHDPKARALAFALYQQADPKQAEALVPTFLQDPSASLRRLAVAERLERANGATEMGQSLNLYREAFSGARDVDQIQQAAAALREAGEEVDISRTMGFLTHWQVVGPFDNAGRNGFARVEPPEENHSLDAVYKGKNGEVKWEPLATADEFGMLDFNKPYGLIKETVAYAQTEYVAAEAREAQIRLGCKNAWKVWLNGELLFERDEYHRGARVDQYILPCTLRAGSNLILVKCCQNEQQERWTVEWRFQLRICDENGTAIHASNRLPTPVAEKTEINNRRSR